MAFYKTGCDWSLCCFIILSLATLLSRTTANSVLVPKEALCALICPDGQQSCEACQQIIPLIATKPNVLKRMSRRSFCENQCKYGLRGSYGAGCGCGHDPTRKRSSSMASNALESTGMNTMNMNCLTICQSGQTSPQCDCATIYRIQKAPGFRNFLQGQSGQETGQSGQQTGQSGQETGQSIISGFSCEALCSIGLGGDKCRCRQ